MAAGKTLSACAEVACEHLARVDPVIGRVIKQVGPFGLKMRRERFPALVRAILFQQLAGRAAQTIYERFVRRFGTDGCFPTPVQVLEADEMAMRETGLSRQKIAYLKNLAECVVSGKLNFRRLAALSDEEVIAELTQIKGIGRWTAEMFLMFNLGRPDVLPVEDLGFRKAVAKSYSLKSLPTPHQLRQIAEPWRPYRTFAVWYLWQTARIITPDQDGARPSKAHRARTVRSRQPLD